MIKRIARFILDNWNSPVTVLMLTAIGMQLSFFTWWTLSKNFAVEEIAFTGREIGIQESVREIPGFLAFLVVYVTLIIREQKLAILSLAMLGFGVAITGYFPTTIGFITTTFIMSVGFHYYETMNQSLQLQWLPKATAPITMGRIIAVSSFAQLIVYGLIWSSWDLLELTFNTVFVVAGGATLVIAAYVWWAFPQFEGEVPQRKSLVLRGRYWLYYALTFMSGARRQIFTVFAGFLMVERFGYHVHEVAALFLVNGIVSMMIAPMVGRWIVKYGERPVLIFEYVGLMLVFTAYAYVSVAWIAAALYIIDHFFFAMAIAMRTYFQKIADPADIAPTAGVSFTINHIAAVVIPVIFGFIWIYSPALVFLLGTGMAAISLVLALMVPKDPAEGNEYILPGRRLAPAE